MKISKNGVLMYLLFLVLLAFTLAGCGKKEKETGNTEVTVTPAATQAPAVTEAPAATEELTTTEAPVAAENDALSGSIRTELTSLELAKLMGNGINLGNTMEAYGHKSLGINADVSSYETLWGQPVTTQDMISTMKAAGFDSLRMPVAWTNMMDFENGDYTINEAYLNRVEEIVNYALNADMYVIINDHWDGGWWGMFGSATQATRDAAMNLYKSMWTQIAERFKNYSDYVIFEGGNEELGTRFNDRDYAADSGSLSEDDCYKLNTTVNQAFVDTIRSTGGNNAERFLLIPGFNTDIYKTCDDRFVMPTDTAKDKLLLSVHYYTPWGYCGNASLNKWGSAKDYKEQNDLLAMMKKFTDQGYGIVFGEYQVALKEDNTVKDNTTDFLNNFLNNCDLYGYVPMLWDCSTQFIRKDLAFRDAGVEKLFKSRSLSAQSALTDDVIAENAKFAIEKAAAAAENVKDEVAAQAASTDKAFAWIMINSGDWGVTYSVGDVYDPNSKTEGLVTTDPEITGPGTYTVSLDFTGTSGGYANGLAFSALGISNGELLYPGYIIDIKEVKVNGEPYTLIGKPYTTSDNAICTRVNLYNSWVNVIPPEARTADGNTSDVSAIIMDQNLGEMKTLEITFDYGPAK